MDIALGSVLLTAIGALLGWFASERTHRLTMHSNRTLDRQLQLEARASLSSWMNGLRAWASEAIEVLSDASYTLRRGDPELTESEEIAIQRFRARLSALIDQGRFLLPNETRTVKGGNKPAAYRGYRHHVLDGLVAAERVLGGDSKIYDFPDRKRALIGLRREFVSVVQAILDPIAGNQEIADLLDHATEKRRTDPTVGGLLPTETQTPVGASGIMRIACERYRAEVRDREVGTPSSK